jgi:hypothetical protein
LDGSGLGANVLPLIEEHFGFLVDAYGFALTQTTEIPSGGWYRAPERAVIVIYDMLRDSTVDVTLEYKGRDDALMLSDVLALHVPEGARRDEIRGRDAVGAELARLAALLREHCDDFLRGNVVEFRQRFREAIFVKRCRELAVREFYNGDLRRAATFFDLLRDYWTDADREHYARASSGQGALASLRRNR